MYYKNFDTKELLHQTQLNVFIKEIKTFEVDFNLFCVFVIILCKSAYDQKLNDQISKRAHCTNQKHIVIYKIFCNNIIIKKLIRSMHKNKSIFEKKIYLFLKCKKKMIKYSLTK